MSKEHAQMDALQRLQTIHEVSKLIFGPDGAVWSVAANKFLRKENPWDYARVTVSRTEAKRIIGRRNFFGPAEIKKAFGFLPESVPPMPFSREELVSAEQLGMLLVYYPAENGEGEPLAIATIAKLVPGNTARSGEKLLYTDQFSNSMSLKSSAWFVERNDQEVLNKRIATGWQLVTPEVLEGTTTSRNYISQTLVLAKKYKATFPDALPGNWEELKQDLTALKDPTAEMLAKHELSQILREPYPNTVFRYLLKEKLTGEKILKSNYSWSNTAAGSDRHLVSFGGAGAEGADVVGSSLDSGWHPVGAVLLRR